MKKLSKLLFLLLTVSILQVFASSSVFAAPEFTPGELGYYVQGRYAPVTGYYEGYYESSYQGYYESSYQGFYQGYYEGTYQGGYYSEGAYQGGYYSQSSYTPTTYELRGTVFRDLNANNSQDAGEAGMSGVTITVKKADSGGNYSINCCSNTSNANGDYTVGQRTTGSYQLTLDVADIPAGWRLGGVSNPRTTTITTGNREVNWPLRQDPTPTPVPTYELRGTVFRDYNGNNSQDAGDTGVSGVFMNIKKADGSGNYTIQCCSNTTNSNGDYNVGQRTRGDYQILLDTTDIPAGWKLGGVANPRVTSITTGNREVNFPLRQLPTPTPTPFVGTNSISGNVFVDENSDHLKSAGESNYTQGTSRVTATHTSGTVWTINSLDGAYQFSSMPAGSYTISYVSIPTGYTVYPSPSSFNVNVGPCSVANTTTGGGCSGANVLNLNFAIESTTPWIQTTGLDVRFQNGLTNKIPATSSCSNYTSLTASSSTPGVVYTGNSNANFGTGTASSTNWVVGGTSFPAPLAQNGSLRSSYQGVLSLIQSSKTTINNLNTVSSCTNYANCQLPSTMNGVYKSPDLQNVTITGGTITGTNKVVLLVNGNISITGNISVDPGAFFMVVSSSHIRVEKNVGAAPSCNATPQLSGIYISNKDFNIVGEGGCGIATDKQLTFAGTIISNANRTGGTFTNNRDLCSQNQNFPSVIVRERPNLIINSPDYIKYSPTVWREVAP